MSFGTRTSELRQAPIPKAGPQGMGAMCSICPLKGRKPVFGDGPPTFQLAIIGEAPGRDEEKAGVPFIGRSGQLLEGFLGRLHISRRSVWIDNAVACFPDGGDMKAFLRVAKKEADKAGREWHTPQKCCRPRLMFALGIPSCSNCGKYEQGEDHCVCPKPRWVRPVGRTPPRAVLYTGNVAMQSIIGSTGIMDRQNYADDLMKHRGGTK